MSNITKEQYEINVNRTFEYIKRFIEKNGYSPSIREIADGTNCKSVETIFTHLRVLREQNKIDFIDGKARTIRIK